MNNDNILELQNITKSFSGVTVLKDVSFGIKRGEVHALLGENGAGKSTLMNIISGVHQKDSGTVIFDGEEVTYKNPKQAQDGGISFVHQELMLCGTVSVAENVFIGRAPKNKLGFVDYDKIYKETQTYLDMFDATFSPKDNTGRLSVACQQIIEISKAVSLDCKLMILDEPTSSLTERETEKLYEVVEKIKNQGISIIFISHRLQEIFDIADRVTVLRDGQYIGTYNVSDITPKELITKTVGREITDVYPEKAQEIGEVKMSVQDFAAEPYVRNINFDLHKKEILGIAGLAGAGRTETVKAICGLLKKTGGKVLVDGEEKEIKNYRQAIKEKICYISEDRKGEGTFLELSIKENTIVSILKEISKCSFINAKKAEQISTDFIKKLATKANSSADQVIRLSGGNQQKVMIAKGLVTNPEVLILDEPTRGVDVGAKAEIHRLIRELANQGLAVLVISSELPEIIGLSDRIMVMHEGEIAGELTGDDMTEKKIILLASGQE